MTTIKPVKRLLPLFIPAEYKIKLDITKRIERIFSGQVTITGTLTNSDNQIILHSRELQITDVKVNNKPANFELLPDSDELIISATGKIVNDCDVFIAFKGKITDSMQGLYPCYFKHDGKDKELLMTQLESHYARTLFPCIDEPAAKAVFDLTLTTEQNITVLGNTPVKSQKNVDGNLQTIFEPTPKMSTYLLAFVTGELDYLETKNQHNVTVRAYATPDKVQFTKFALDFAAKVLDYYDDYFDVPYPLDKCDMVAVPDFASGAMENWGLVTYRESCMLVDEKNTPSDVKEWVAAVVAHELSHQWFGNLVTMQWWDDLWLNESFAKWMEHYAVDHFMPEWQVWEQFSSGEQQGSMARDSLASVQAVHQPVHHPDELHSLFDSAIVYAKGSCLIRMLHEYLGAKTFRDGLRIYMQRHKYSNTQANDLWAALSEVSGKDVQAFMGAWLDQPGHPVISIEPNGTSVKVSQKRFYANPLQAKNADSSIWPVPLLCDQLEEPILTEQSKSIAKKPGTLFVNNGYTGFYHTMYSPEYQAQLAKQVCDGKIPTVNRLSLLADGMALAKSGLGSTSDLIKLAANYKNESSYPVWRTIGGVIGTIRMLIGGDKQLKRHLQKYVHDLVHGEYARLGWDKIKGEPYFDELQRPDMISYMAYTEDSEVIEHCLQLFDDAKQPEDIHPDIRSIVYAVAIRERGRSAYDRQLEWYKTTTSAEERINLAAGITSMRDKDLAREVTTLFTTKLIKPQDLFYWFIYLIRSQHGKKPAWDWMVKNWEWIEKSFKGGHDYADFPKYAASALNTREYLEEYRKFFTPKLAETELERVIKQGLEDIEVRVLWRERDLQDVSEFLKGIKL